MLEKLRLQAPVLGKKDPEWLAGYQLGEFSIGSKKIWFRLYLPEGFQPDATQKFALMLWLHGVKGRGEDNQKQVAAGNSHGPAFFCKKEVQEQLPMIVLVPQCPMGKFWINFTNNRIRKPLKRVMKLVDLMKSNLPIDNSRIYIGGQSMGGFATWTALAEYPKLFAAAIPVSGGGSTRKARRTIQAPVWAFHGSQDPIVGVGRSREMIETLKKAGRAVRYTEYAAGKHDIWPLVMQEEGLLDWLKEQKVDLPAKKK